MLQIQQAKIPQALKPRRSATQALAGLKITGSPEKKREDFSDAMKAAKGRATTRIKKELPEEQ